MSEAAIIRALLTSDPAERAKAEQRLDLLSAVQRKITCEDSGVILDVRTAVMVKIEVDRGHYLSVFDGAAWDAKPDAFRVRCADMGTVIDGRKL